MSKTSKATASASAAAQPPIERKPVTDPDPNPTPAESTSTRLFPDLLPPAPAAEPEDQPTADPSPEPAAPAPEKPAEDTPAAPEPAVEPDQVADLDELLTKLKIDPAKVKIRTKVLGEESEISLAELKKGYQTDQALTTRGQKIGEERKKLEELRQQLLYQARFGPDATGRGAPAPAPGFPDPETDGAVSNDPEVKRLRQEVQNLQSMIPALQPVIHQSARQKVADELKEVGFDDFLAYIPKIDARVAQVESENLWRYYNTPEGAKSLYFQIKAEELKERTLAPQPPVPAPRTPIERPKPPIIKINGGSGPGAGVVDDWQAKYQEAWNRWKQSGKKEDLDVVLQMKNAI